MLFSRFDRTISRILIVEDVPVIAFDSELWLSDAGYQVVATVDAESDALAIIANDEVDLVVADIGLSGGGSGLNVARAARARGRSVLLMTGSPPSDGHLHAEGCLVKPFQPRDLERAIEALDRLRQGKSPGRTPSNLILYRR